MGTTQKPSDVYLEVQKAFENGLEKTGLSNDFSVSLDGNLLSISLEDSFSDAIEVELMESADKSTVLRSAASEIQNCAFDTPSTPEAFTVEACEDFIAETNASEEATEKIYYLSDAVCNYELDGVKDAYKKLAKEWRAQGIYKEMEKIRESIYNLSVDLGVKPKDINRKVSETVKDVTQLYGVQH